VEPVAEPVARPPGGLAATEVLLDTHVAAPVRSRVEPSEYCPVAVNCWTAPAAMVAFAGEVLMPDRVGAPSATVASVAPVTLPTVAETTVEPAATMVARPVLPMVSADWFDDPHTAWLVRSWVDASEYVPVAVNCRVPGAVRFGFAGVTAIDKRVAGAVLTAAYADGRELAAAERPLTL
jgi:hypothetical protein